MRFKIIKLLFKYKVWRLSQRFLLMEDFIFYKYLDFMALRKFKKLIQSLTPVEYGSLPNDESKIYKPIVIKYPIELKEE